MSSSSKKNKKASKKHTAAGITQAGKIQSQDIFPLILLVLYIITGLIPPLGSVDVMGSQWLYLAGLNLLSLGYITVKRNLFYNAVNQISSSLFTLLYIVLFIIAGISILSAINKTESFVAYSRLANTVAAFLSCSILLHNRLHLFKIAGRLIIILLLIDSYKTLSDFFNGLGEIEIDKIISNLKGNTGNKNILAASIAVKIPFVIYYIRDSKITARVLYSIVIAMAALSLFLINARATYVSLLLSLFLYGIYCILIAYKKESSNREAISQFGFVLLPIVVTFFIAQKVLDRAIKEQATPSGYGTVTKRLGEVGLSAAGSGGRTLLWKNAINYIQQHPFKGCGYGNWKLAAIPYDRNIYDDFNVSNHTHNDFLEMATEAGLPAGIIYFALFVCLAFYAVKTILTGNSIQKHLAVLTLLALSVYFIDASLNFPAERPVMQSHFIFIAALLLNFFISSKKISEQQLPKRSFWPLLTVIGFLILCIPALWISRQVYRSMVLQSFVNPDTFKPKPEGNWQEYINAFPSIPNLNVRAIPNDILIARYLMADKKYDMALTYLNSSKRANPYLGYDALLKMQIFEELNNPDSAFYYAKETFYTKPRAQYNFQKLCRISITRKDSNTIKDAFKEYIKYRNEPWAWNEYVYSLSVLSHPTTQLIAITDSALKLFPQDKDLQEKKLALTQSKTVAGSAELKNVTTATSSSSTNVTIYSPEKMDYFNKASLAYSKADYNTALKYFLKIAELDKEDHLALENAGLSYMAMHDYKNAIIYLDKALQKNRSVDGKAEFYKGKALYFLGRTAEACEYFKLSNNKNYVEAPEYVKMACK